MHTVIQKYDVKRFIWLANACAETRLNHHLLCTNGFVRSEITGVYTPDHELYDLLQPVGMSGVIFPQLVLLSRAVIPLPGVILCGTSAQTRPLSSTTTSTRIPLTKSGKTFSTAPRIRISKMIICTILKKNCLCYACRYTRAPLHDQRLPVVFV